MSDADKTNEFDHPVVAVGASAGGVEALKTFVSEIPTDTTASFIIIQHLAPDHDSQLGDILARVSELPVLEADENMPVASGHIYVIQPAKYLTIVDHGGGYLTLYGYNQSLLRDVGEWVAVGDTLALAGQSGGNSRSALYFEIRNRGKVVNPTRWCDRRVTLPPIARN